MLTPYNTGVFTEEEQGLIVEDNARFKKTLDDVRPKMTEDLDSESTERQPLLAESRLHEGGGGGGVTESTFRRKAKRRHTADGGIAVEPSLAREEPAFTRIQREPYPILSREAQDMYEVFRQRGFQNVRYREVRQFFELENFKVKNMTGSHSILTKGAYRLHPYRTQEVAGGTLRSIFHNIGL